MRAQMAHGLRPIYQTGDDGEDIDIDDIECAADKTRMMPLRDRASDGRVTPRGIPCLYVATDDAMAGSEVRPAIGAYVTVAVLKCLREPKLIDCSMLAEKQFIYFKEPERAELEKAVWSDIDRHSQRRQIGPTTQRSTLPHRSSLSCFAPSVTTAWRTKARSVRRATISRFSISTILKSSGVDCFKWKTLRTKSSGKPTNLRSTVFRIVLDTA